MHIHREHGLNPTISTCYYCLETKNEIVLLGASCKEEAPRQMWIPGDMTPCDNCKESMEIGILFICVTDGEVPTVSVTYPASKDAPARTVDIPNPYRTGKLVVLKQAAVERLLSVGSTKNAVLRKRFCFVPDTVWKRMGLPDNDVEGVPNSLAAYKAAVAESSTPKTEGEVN